MAHSMKVSKGGCGHMLAHYERAVDSEGEYVKFGNQDIDLTRTHLNYNLAPDRVSEHGSQYGFLKDRLKEVFCLNRKDVNVMVDWAVTLPKDFPRERQKEFFEQTYKFLTERYGGEDNVISSYVHMDETTPHMHFSFVPVIWDEKRERLKVSAKEVITLLDLKTFHGDLSERLEQHFGFEVGVLNEATLEGNKSIEDLKRSTAIQTANLVSELEQTREALGDFVKFAKDKLNLDHKALHQAYKDWKSQEVAKTPQKANKSVQKAKKQVKR